MKLFIVKDLAGKVLAKCKTSRNQTEFANSANCPTVCMTIIKTK